MNYSDYCKMKQSQQVNFNWFGDAVSTVKSGVSDAARAARNAVNKAVSNLKTAIKDQVTGKQNSGQEVDPRTAKIIRNGTTTILKEEKSSNGESRYTQIGPSYNDKGIANRRVKDLNDGRTSGENVKYMACGANAAVKKMNSNKTGQKCATSDQLAKAIDNKINDEGPVNVTT